MFTNKGLVLSREGGSLFSPDHDPSQVCHMPESQTSAAKDEFLWQLPWPCIEHKHLLQS